MATTITSAIEDAGAQAAKQMGLFEEEPTEIKSEEPAPTEEVKEEGEVEAEPEEVVEEETQQAKSKYVPMSRFNEIYHKNKELERVLEQVLTDQQQLSAAFQQAQQKSAPPPDFESMTNTELVQYLIQKSRQDTNQAVNSAVMPVASAVRMENLDKEIQKAATSHKDFWDYRDKMIEISNQHPTLSAEETYQLASGNKDAVKKSILQRTSDQAKRKQAAKTETRSSPAAKVSENTQYKTTREAGLAVAKKLGLL